MRKITCIITGAIVVLSVIIGCIKMPAANETAVDVYVAGHEKNAAGNFVAKYLKNSVPVNLTDGTKTAYASSIVVSGNDVYVGGGEYASPNGPYIAKIWKNGIATNLSNGIK